MSSYLTIPFKGEILKKEVVNKSAANYSNETETKFSPTIYGWNYQIFVLNVINFDKSKKMSYCH